MAPTTQAAADSFCDYAVKVMQRYPYVRKAIIGNEPNQPKFWQPIWNGSQPASPAAMAVVLASCYDKLKALDATLDVIGVGLSPRGNDNPGASSNSSISPVRWIKALGDAYRAMGRQKPLFDEWSWHCYPNVNTDEVETGYAWPNTGCVNAARVKLALWDAFHALRPAASCRVSRQHERHDPLRRHEPDVRRRDGLAGRHGEPAGLHEQ